MVVIIIAPFKGRKRRRSMLTLKMMKKISLPSKTRRGY
jgi:hypothetical protein